MGRSRRRRIHNQKTPHPQPSEPPAGDEADPPPADAGDGDGEGPAAHDAELAEARDAVRKLAMGIGRMEERADAVAAKIEGLCARHRPRAGGRRAADPEELRRIKRELRRQREILAGRGTREFALMQEAGKHVGQINGKRVPLSPTQAVLLAILTWDNGRSEDGLVGWKASRDVASQVGRRMGMGKPMSPGALRQNVLRLRRRLERFGVDSYLVQTRGSQMRFALRRSAPGAGPRATER